MKERETMGKVRASAFSVSLDGFGAGPNQDLQHPFGVGGMELPNWLLKTRMFHEMIGQPGGTTDTDDAFARKSMENVGAWIMGRNMFGPIRGQWPDHSWKGWWGPNPPYHVPVFVLTHHPRPPLEMEGGTVFHFVTDGIEAALERATAIAGAQGRSHRRRRLRCQAISAGRPARRTPSGRFAGPSGERREPVRGARPAGAGLCLHRKRPRHERDPRHRIATADVMCARARR